MPPCTPQPTQTARLEPFQLSLHHEVQQQEVECRNAAGGKGQAAMTPAQAKREYPIEQQIQAHGQETHQHRRLASVERVESIDQYLQGRIAAEANGVEPQRTGRLRSLDSIEFPVLIQH